MDLYICNVKLGDQPLVAGSVNDTDVLTLSHDLLNPADILELRIDMFEDLSQRHIENVFKVAKEKLRKPIIATVRDVNEGGQKEIADRLALYKIVIPFADIVDVEINSVETFMQVRELCTIYRKYLIGSYHNFEFTPDDAFLDGVIMKGNDLGADLIKIAAMAKSKEDLTRLMFLALKYKDKKMITMSMGDTGLPSRVFGPLFGSLITYGYFTKPSAPGQISVSELLYILRRLKIR